MRWRRRLLWGCSVRVGEKVEALTITEIDLKIAGAEMDIENAQKRIARLQSAKRAAAALLNGAQR